MIITLLFVIIVLDLERAKEASQRSTLLGTKSVEQRQRFLGNYPTTTTLSFCYHCVSIIRNGTDAPSIRYTCCFHCISSIDSLTLLLYLWIWHDASLIKLIIVRLTDANDKLLRQNDMIANAQRTVAETEEVGKTCKYNLSQSHPSFLHRTPIYPLSNMLICKPSSDIISLYSTLTGGSRNH